jgi:butyryl-CoA dehydrogenase
MAVEVHGLRLMLYHVAREMDSGTHPTQKLLMLRYQASETATRIGDMACDIFGAYGLMEDQPIAKMVEYARMSRHWPEPTEPLKFEIARDVFE